MAMAITVNLYYTGTKKMVAASVELLEEIIKDSYATRNS